jgi:hypothetical protein
MSSAQDYKLLALRLRQAVEKYILKEPEEGGEILAQLPKFPKVEVRDGEILIIAEDGDVEIWDNENDVLKAIAVAEILELELRAINYVKFSLINYLYELAEDLKKNRVPAESVDDIIYEGYKSLEKYFLQLD